METPGEGDPDSRKRKFAINALTTVTISQVALEQIIAAPGGRIVNIGAMAALKAEADYGTWVQPQAIADTVVFLASPSARSISGELIPVTKGVPPS